MSDTFFTASPHWTWFIIPYFYIGGIAGGSYFLAALLEWFGRPGDERVARLGYYVAALGAIVSALLLSVDLRQPLRFWHMLLQSDRFPLLILKSWSPMSIGSWALTLFGLFAVVSALGALAAEQRAPGWLCIFHQGAVARIWSAVGAFFGFFVAGYTGVLLDVTNRPVWGDTTVLGVLVLLSAGSTAAATLTMLTGWRYGYVDEPLGKLRPDPSIRFLHWFDGWTLVLELLVLLVFLATLGAAFSVWLDAWGIALLLLVIGLGLLLPLALHFRPGWFSPHRRKVMAAALAVLVGGFFLRLILVLAAGAVGSHEMGA